MRDIAALLSAELLRGEYEDAAGDNRTDHGRQDPLPPVIAPVSSICHDLLPAAWIRKLRASWHVPEIAEFETPPGAYGTTRRMGRFG